MIAGHNCTCFLLPPLSDFGSWQGFPVRLFAVRFASCGEAGGCAVAIA